ncbi:MAG: DUF1080 domain-containing protein [Calditrichota bacterium]
MWKQLSRALGLLALAAILMACTQSQAIPTDRHPDTTGWPNLLEPDLSNANYEPGSWVMEDGVLHALNHTTLWTKASYKDFVLYLEFKVSPGANSGIFFPAQRSERYSLRPGSSGP